MSGCLYEPPVEGAQADVAVWRPGRLAEQSFVCPRPAGPTSEAQPWAGPVPPGASLLGVRTPSPPRVLTRSLCVSYKDIVLWNQVHPRDLVITSPPL